MKIMDWYPGMSCCFDPLSSRLSRVPRCSFYSRIPPSTYRYPFVDRKHDLILYIGWTLGFALIVVKSRLKLRSRSEMKCYTIYRTLSAQTGTLLVPLMSYTTWRHASEMRRKFIGTQQRLLHCTQPPWETSTSQLPSIDLIHREFFELFKVSMALLWGSHKFFWKS